MHCLLFLDLSWFLGSGLFYGAIHCIWKGKVSGVIKDHTHPIRDIPVSYLDLRVDKPKRIP